MATTPYKPVTWTDEAVTNTKLRQMTNNDQWLFENGTKFRYTSAGLTRDSGLKMIAGKTAYPIDTTKDWSSTEVQFGTFFSAGCRPVITATVEFTGGWARKYVSIRAASGVGTQIDHRGFAIVFSTNEPGGIPRHVEAPGWFHWQAIGY